LPSRGGGNLIVCNDGTGPLCVCVWSVTVSVGVCVCRCLCQCLRLSVYVCVCVAVWQRATPHVVPPSNRTADNPCDPANGSGTVSGSGSSGAADIGNPCASKRVSYTAPMAKAGDGGLPSRRAGSGGSPPAHPSKNEGLLSFGLWVCLPYTPQTHRSIGRDHRPTSPPVTPGLGSCPLGEGLGEGGCTHPTPGVFRGSGVHPSR
jgi:hypothetical protein